jgi:hypothetical protein
VDSKKSTAIVGRETNMSRCPICQEFVWPSHECPPLWKAHECPPLWKVQEHDHHDFDDPEDYTNVHARNVEEAA